MKTITSKILKTFFLFSIFFSLFSALAQAPQKMSYQAVIRNASNTLIANSNVGMRISVLQGTVTGTAVYVETQTPITNTNGLATLEIGSGTVVSGTFASIAWGTNAYYIKTETDPTGGTNYTITGTTQFLSVPYALYAANSDSVNSNWTTTGNNIANNNTGNVGIGTGATLPYSPLTVQANGIGFTQEDSTQASRVGFYTSENSAWVQTHSNTDLSFSTNNDSSQMVLQKATGNFGIGTDTPTEKLQVAGKTKTTTLQVTTGAGAGKVLTSDATGNAAWQTPTSPPAGTVNQQYEHMAFNLSTTIQGSEVDFPATNINVPVSGTYLITYYMRAKNNFYSYCLSNCTTPKVYYTNSHLYNKTTNSNYQTMQIDFSLTDDSDIDGLGTLTEWSCPEHQVSGSVVKTLLANDQIGFKLGSFADAGATATISLQLCTITLVRLY